MDYFSRLMKRIEKRREFKFHPRCVALAINHLIFANDLMLFSKGDVQSTMLLKRTLKAFTATSRLEASHAKSVVYFGNVKEEIQNKILQIIGF